MIDVWRELEKFEAKLFLDRGCLEREQEAIAFA